MVLNVTTFGDYFSKMIKLIECLTKTEIETCLKTLNELQIHYEDLPEGFNFKTLGAATYLHYGQEDENTEELGLKYNRIKSKTNPILMKNFKWVYEILLKKISEELKQECIISEEADLAFPGFHVFYPHKECEKVSHPPHLDFQWAYHLNALKEKFNTVEDDRFLTFTLSIKLPDSGAGLYYWDLPSYNKQYSFNQAEEIMEETLCKANNLFSISDGYISREEYEKATNPSILKYKEGYMTIFTQPILHQIMPFNSGWNDDDKRITLQGHGIMCDQIWRLYF